MKLKKQTQKTVMLNSFQHPLHFPHANKVEILNQVQDDNMMKTTCVFPARAVIPQACSAGYSRHSAFTLIELLVVVLIIGILVAIAVPQYKIAVEKSKASSIIPIIRAIYTAQQAYFLANGSYATTFAELDIEPPFSTEIDDTNTQIIYPNEQKIILESSGVKFYPNTTYNYFLKYHYNGSLFCWARDSNANANTLCKHITGQESDGDSGGFNRYTMHN